MNRNKFLKSLIGASTLLATPLHSFTRIPSDLIQEALNDVSKNVNGSAFGLKDKPIKKVRIGIIGLGNRGQVLSEMFHWLIENNRAEIVALSDLSQKKVNTVIEKIQPIQKEKIHSYCKNPHDWKTLVQREDLDLILIATPWELHTPMALYSMEQGKHVACEVPIAYTIEDCWKLVETAEKTQKHCIMIENCCYNEEELWVLNMIENGVFGDLTHAEGAYIHDLRKHLLDANYYEDQWRIKHHTNRDGNFYTTHGLGPISFYMKIGRGDTFSHLTSMSSRELNLSQTAKQFNSPYTSIKCGDMNTTMIKTEKGKTIMLQFDVHTGSPYSRINKVVGTHAVHNGYPSRLYIDNKKELKYWGHEWLSEEDFIKYKKDFQHPIIKQLHTISENYKQGHGGMDFVMIYRLITCLNLGLPLDINVYDSVLWSAITPLSELSVLQNSNSINVPDFTGGTWKKNHPLEIMRTLS